jgi:RHS repeat-associated protein
MNRLISRTDPLGNIDTREYDLNGNLIKFTDRRGLVTRFEYDELNRLVRELYDNGATVDREYDRRGRLIRIDDTEGDIITFAYDSVGRLIRGAGPNGTLEYAYDELGRTMVRQVVGEGPVNYEYDPVDNLLSANSSVASVSFEYDALNRRTAIRRSNGVDSAYVHDVNSRIRSIIHVQGAKVLNRQDYSYDEVGSRKSYDANIGSPLLTQSTAGVFDEANRLINRDGISYSYDENGNRASKTSVGGTTNYNWDARNRLSSISRSDGIVTNFRYDPLNNLISHSVGDANGRVVREFVVDDLTNVVNESRNTGESFEILTGRVLDDHLTVTETNGPSHFLLRDALDSTVATADANGAINQQFSYEPYGQRTLEGYFPFLFTGRMPSTDGLYYHRARFYDPNAARFISEDPAGFRALETNLYRYASGNPVKFIDPTGNLSLATPVGLAVCVALGAITTAIFDADTIKDAVRDVSNDGTGGNNNDTKGGEACLDDPTDPDGLKDLFEKTDVRDKKINQLRKVTRDSPQGDLVGTLVGVLCALLVLKVL